MQFCELDRIRSCCAEARGASRGRQSGRLGNWLRGSQPAGDRPVRPGHRGQECPPDPFLDRTPQGGGVADLPGRHQPVWGLACFLGEVPGSPANGQDCLPVPLVLPPSPLPRRYLGGLQRELREDFFGLVAALSFIAHDPLAVELRKDGVLTLGQRVVSGGASRPILAEDADDFYRLGE